MQESALTLTFNLETWFKVKTHPLPYSTIWVKYWYMPDNATGSEHKLRTKITFDFDLDIWFKVNVPTDLYHQSLSQTCPRGEKYISLIDGQINDT